MNTWNRPKFKLPVDGTQCIPFCLISQIKVATPITNTHFIYVFDFIFIYVIIDARMQIASQDMLQITLDVYLFLGEEISHIRQHDVVPVGKIKADVFALERRIVQLACLIQSFEADPVTLISAHK